MDRTVAKTRVFQKFERPVVCRDERIQIRTYPLKKTNFALSAPVVPSQRCQRSACVLYTQCAEMLPPNRLHLLEATELGLFRPVLRVASCRLVH